MVRVVARGGRSVGDRGAATIFIVVGLGVFLGAVAIAVDLGRLAHARTESQRVADLAALAGAGAFVNASGSEAAETARAWAIEYAARNIVSGAPVTLLPTDIDVDPVSTRVDVTVRHTAARGNAIPTVFARAAFGVSEVDVVTHAAAQAFAASGATCPLPLMLSDQWDERGGDPDRFDPGIDYYQPYDPQAPTNHHTGFDAGDIGTPILLKPAQGQVSRLPGPLGGAPTSGSRRPNPSWYSPFDAGHIPGGANYRSAIRQCPNLDFVYSMGMGVWVEPGAMVGPTLQGFSDLIGQDPTAAWDPRLNCVVDANRVGSVSGRYCRSSPRLRVVPMYDPRDAPANGKKQVPISNFSGVFVDRMVGNDVWVILTGYSGVGPVGTTAPVSSAPLLRVVRLIE